MKKILAMLIISLLIFGNLGQTYALNERGSIGKLFEFLNPKVYKKTENGGAINRNGEFRINGANIKDHTVSSYELQDDIEIKNLKINTLQKIGNEDININSPMVLNYEPKKGKHVVHKIYVDNILKGINNNLKIIASSIKKLTLLINGISSKFDSLTREIKKNHSKITSNESKLNTILAKLSEIEKKMATTGNGTGGTLTVYKSDGKTVLGKFYKFSSVHRPAFLGHSGQAIQYFDLQGNQRTINPIHRATDANIGGSAGIERVIMYKGNTCTGKKYIDAYHLIDWRYIERNNLNSYSSEYGDIHSPIYDYKEKKAFMIKGRHQACWSGAQYKTASYVDKSGKCISHNYYYTDCFVALDQFTITPKICGYGDCKIK